MNTYELTVIINSSLSDDQTESVKKEVEDYLSRQGAEISTFEVWGKRRLAYQIKKQTHGYYILYTLKLEPNSAKIREIEQHFRRTDNILRSMIIRIDEQPLPEKPKEAEAEYQEETTPATSETAETEKTHPVSQPETEQKTAETESDSESARDQ